MRKRLCMGLMAIAAALTEPSSAQSASSAPGIQAPTATAAQQRLFRGSKIIGATVRDLQENKIGVIKDLMLDSRRGEIAYAVIRFGGVVNGGKTYHAVPWQALIAADDGKSYTLQADENTIAAAPGFDKAKWPDMADRKWGDAIDRYWTARVGSGANTNEPLAAPGVSNPRESGGGSSSGANE